MQSCWRLSRHRQRFAAHCITPHMHTRTRVVARTHNHKHLSQSDSEERVCLAFRRQCRLGSKSGAGLCDNLNIRTGLLEIKELHRKKRACDVRLVMRRIFACLQRILDGGCHESHVTRHTPHATLHTCIRYCPIRISIKAARTRHRRQIKHHAIG